ncbi:MAG: phage holin family protein [Woeseia sp.]
MNQGHKTAPAPAASRDQGAESITDLIRNLASDLSSLLGKEMQLAKSEIRESVSDVQTAIGGIATGTALSMAGLVVLLMSGVYGLSNVVEPWLAALIVGAVALLIGYVMVHSAKEKMSSSSLAPDRTLDSAKKDVNTLERAVR